MNTSAILLMNLGSPDRPDTQALRSYLTEFLMDERVIDTNVYWRNILVKGLIVPFRASASAAKYKSVWTEEGSPLVAHTRRLSFKLQEEVPEPVYYSMRYGNPSTADTLQRIHREHPDLEHLIIFPLYPHYAMSSYETAVEQVKKIHRQAGYKTSFTIIPPFFDNPMYIDALAGSIKPFLETPFDHILFSYHGLPERHIRKTDCSGSHCLVVNDCCRIKSESHSTCYRHQVIETTELVAKRLNLKPEQYSFSFQSRLGRDAWLKPYTVQQLRAFPEAGIRRLLILCPAFVSDCLETLEEIAMEGRQIFMESGGEEFHMIPALNENADWVNCMVELVSGSRR